jgi:hypothetical protein
MLGRQRALKVALASAAIVMSGGTAVAFAATNVGSRAPTVHSSDVTDSTDTTVDGGSSTTLTSSTTTSVQQDTTTSVEADTTTTVETVTTETTVANDTSTTTTVAAPPTECKPGWGYGDTNHCHSGPPGLAKHGNGAMHGKHGHGTGAHHSGS